MSPRAGASIALLAAAFAVAVLPSRAHAARYVQRGPVKIWTVHYRAHDGLRRNAYVMLPAWYGPRRHPRIPLVISPHGRGLTGRENVQNWGSLPARGTFAVISPDGQGRVLGRYSWGAPGQIEDLARMPQIAVATLPWLRVDRRHVYAFGGSMGGQETLLLLARHPRLLAGAAAFDSVVDFAQQYRQFPQLPCNKACHRLWNGSFGKSLQSLAREEIGGAPSKAVFAWRRRSPITYARAIARSCVPLQMWWSRNDEIVRGQRQRQSGLLFRDLKRLNPRAPILAVKGYWRHSHEMTAKTLLPVALAEFDLLPPDDVTPLRGVHVVKPSADASDCRH